MTKLTKKTTTTKMQHRQRRHRRRQRRQRQRQIQQQRRPRQSVAQVFWPSSVFSQPHQHWQRRRPRHPQRRKQRQRRFSKLWRNLLCLHGQLLRPQPSWTSPPTRRRRQRRPLILILHRRRPLIRILHWFWQFWFCPHSGWSRNDLSKWIYAQPKKPDHIIPLPPHGDSPRARSAQLSGISRTHFSRNTLLVAPFQTSTKRLQKNCMECTRAHRKCVFLLMDDVNCTRCNKFHLSCQFRYSGMFNIFYYIDYQNHLLSLINSYCFLFFTFQNKVAGMTLKNNFNYAGFQWPMYCSSSAWCQ